MKIALAQLNYTIGAFEENAEKIILAIRQARQERAALVVFSELAICGYPPMDLLEHKYFLDKCESYLNQIASECHGIAAIIGGPSVNPNPLGKNLFNSAFFMANGSVQHVIHKTLLPTYDIFDEYRYFEQNTDFNLISYKGFNIAVTICEDLWYKQPILTGFGKDRLYGVCPMDRLASLCPDFVINIAASPFSYMQVKQRKEYSLTMQAGTVPVYYVNQVGAHAELIFDGGSMVVNPQGVVSQMKQFEEDFRIYETDEAGAMSGGRDEKQAGNGMALVHDALVLGIKDYFGKTGLKTALLGLSGGIDSAVTLVLATRALGSTNMRVLLMPSQYSSSHSVSDAIALARNLGVRYDIIDIRDILAHYTQSLETVFKGYQPDSQRRISRLV
jgi:NAD+ synthase (glutamine-hydrolysing)